MILALVITLYALIAFPLVARPVAGDIAWRLAKADGWGVRQEKPDCFDWTLGIVMGILAGAAWPLMPVVILAITSIKALNKISPRIGAEKKELEAQRERKIKETEKALNL